jgi:hypothetical protein
MVVRGGAPGTDIGSEPRRVRDIKALPQIRGDLPAGALSTSAVK